MNYLFLAQSDLIENPASVSPSEFAAVLSSDRAREALKDHDLKAGLSISCVIENLGSGKVTIGACHPEKIEMTVTIQEALPARLPLDLVVAYSRPQTLKKLLQLSASVGLRSLSFVKTANVVPSYLQSKSLEPDQICRQFILGCEQAGDGVFPQLNQFKNFHEFIKSPMVLESKGQKLFGESASKVDICAASKETLLFLGPESGFTLEEKNILYKSGFMPASLGPRMLRVEIAAAMLIGVISQKT